MRPPRALPATHFERNNITIICETVHEIDNVLTIIKTLLHTIAPDGEKNQLRDSRAQAAESSS
jgi:hypothetical protein